MFYCIIKIELSFNAYKFSSLQFDFYATMLSAPVTYHSILSHFYNPHLDMNEFLHTLAVLAVCQIYAFFKTLRCRHNERDGVSNHQPQDCLLNRLFRRRSKKHQSSASLALVWGIHQWPMNSPHKGPVTRKMFPFDRHHDVIMKIWLLELRNLMQFIQYTIIFCCVWQLTSHLPHVCMLI